MNGTFPVSRNGLTSIIPLFNLLSVFWNEQILIGFCALCVYYSLLWVQIVPSVLLIVDLFLFCYERDFMLSLSHENKSSIIDAFNSSSRYLDDLPIIDKEYFEQMVNTIYPKELQVNKSNTSDADAIFISTVWSESSLGQFWIAKDANFLRTYVNSDQTARMRGLIWVFDGAHVRNYVFSHVATHL